MITNKTAAFKAEFKKAVDEFAKIYDDVTTSDLQGLVEVRAYKLLQTHNPVYTVKDVDRMSDRILEGIYRIKG